MIYLSAVPDFQLALVIADRNRPTVVRNAAYLEQQRRAWRRQVADA